MRKILPLLAVLVLLLAAGGARAQQGVPSGGYNQNSGSGTPAAIGTVGPYFNVQSPTYNPSGTVGKGGCATDISTNATSTVTSAGQLAAGTYYGYSAPAVGDIAWVITASGSGPCNTLSANAGLTATLRIPATASTITTVTAVNLSAGTVTLSSGTVTTQSGDVLFWADSGDPGDYTAIAAACTAVPKNGGTVYLPKGLYVLGTNASGNPTCLITSSVTGSAGLLGDGEDQTLIFPAPWYAHTYNFGSVFAFANTNFAYWSGWTLDGQGIALAYGPDTPVEPSTPALDHVTVRNWNLTSGSTESLYIASGGAPGYHTYINNSFISASGTNQYGCAISGPYALMMSNTICISGKGALEFTGSGGGANVSIVGGQYMNTNTAGNVLSLPVSGTPGASYISISGGAIICDEVVGTGTDAISLNRTGWVLDLDSVYINAGIGCAPTTDVNGIVTVAGSTVHMAKTQLAGIGTGNVVNNAGTFYDDGGNTFTLGAGWTGTGASLLSPTSTGLNPTITGTGACASPVATGTVALAGSNTCPGSSGAATLTLTWAPNAPHSYICPLPRDVTTGGDLFTFTSSSATACVYGAAAVVTNDVITWGVVGQY